MTAAWISASEYCCAPGEIPFERTAPVARILMKSAPFLKFVRTALRHFVGAVREIPDDRDVHVDRELPRVARPPGRRDIVASHEKPGARNCPLVDGVSQRDVHVRPARPHLAAHREAREKRVASVLRSPERGLGRRRRHERFLPVHTEPVGQMRVQVDQPRQKRGAPEVDHAGAGRHGKARSDRGDMVPLDDHYRRREGRTAAAVNEPRGPHHDRRRVGRERRRRKEPEAQRREQALHLSPRAVLAMNSATSALNALSDGS